MGICNSSNGKHKHDTKIHRVSTLPDNIDKTIMECKMSRDKISKYIKSLEVNEIKRKDKAKEALRNKQRDRAKMFLSQSKLYREQIKSASGQLTMIQEQIIQIETVRQQQEAVRVLEQGNKILKQLYEEVNVEKWEKISDDMNEVKQQQDEIGNFLKNHGINQDQYDEEVDKELEALMKQENKEIEFTLPEIKKEIPIVEPKHEIINGEEIKRVAIEN